MVYIRALILSITWSWVLLADFNCIFHASDNITFNRRLHPVDRDLCQLLDTTVLLIICYVGRTICGVIIMKVVDVFHVSWIGSS